MHAWILPQELGKFDERLWKDLVACIAITLKHPTTMVEELANPLKISRGRSSWWKKMAVCHGNMELDPIEASMYYKTKADAHRRNKEFEEGELVMVYLPKERFPAGSYNKLKQTIFWSCQIIKKLGPNAYRSELPQGFSISPVFNISDLYAYYGDDKGDPLKVND
ncbi:hypothetical protein RHSIM_Rhsim04G0077500 [Rhododendron simsii]|uniref:Tf2-1-like SH3-like domain-containing protein n=1 Tax=Rhododendron simsii TaxID=118357 RepID=A0A834H4C0_RHOSS|nr:hypothetical protein RHSIM_Rhsim04G0077500 [Rhododendron simsii]